MGVADLMSLLKRHAPRAFSSVAPVCRGTAWVDAPLIVMAAYKKAQADGTQPSLTSTLQKTIACALGTGAARVNLVFDGPTRKAKMKTVSARSVAHDAFHKRCVITFSSILASDLAIADKISSRHIHTSTFEVLSPSPSCVSYFEFLSEAKRTTLANVLIAPHDAEEFIAGNMEDDDVAVTIDSDALAFGCPRVVQYLGKPNETWVSLPVALEDMNLTMEQFRILCVVLGNDFSNRIFGVGPVACLADVRKGLNLDSFAIKHNADEEWRRAAQQALDIFELKDLPEQYKRFTRESVHRSGSTDTPPLE